MTDKWMSHEDFYAPITTTTTGDYTVTINGSTLPNYNDPGQLNLGGKDLTPADDIETAQLKLQGICPACRCTNNDHEWNCKHYDYSTSIDTNAITFNSSSITTTAPTTITLGSETLTEEKITKLDKLLDLFDDDELDQLMLDKITKRLTVNKNSV